MPLVLSMPLAKWLKGFHLVQGEVATNGQCEISYNDQLYFQNGYSIGQLLKDILKTKGYASQALMRIRKIAHISSNQNWRIIKEIMEEIGFPEEIDPHAITLELVQGILQYLFQHFCPKMESRVIVKEKRNYIDPASFSVNKPLDQSYNLLEFYLLVVSKAFGIPLQESLGLLVENSKYFKKVVIQGTNNNAYEPVLNFYKIVTHNMPLINKLIAQEYQSQRPFMNNLGLAVLSENNQVCQIGCIMIDNLESNLWLQQEGFSMLLRSPHEKVLDLLLRKVHPNFALIFNEQISSKFPNKYIEHFTYSKLLKYLHKSIYSRQIFELLPLNHYIKSAFEVFQPDNVKKLPKKLKLMTKNLLKVIVNYFWSKLQYQQKNRICFSFDPQFCESEEERITTLCYLFEIITQLSIREVEFVKKFYRIINKYYSKGTIDIRTFIFNNLVFLYQNHPDHFAIGFFLETYEIANPVQACDYQLIQQLSRNRSLTAEEALMILKVCTIYYYQQLQAACFIQPINNILKSHTSVEWASQLAQEILTKWPTLPIPPFQMLPPNTNKIKFRSIGLKKKEMLQFTELNRYKRILKLLTTVKSRDFLMLFGRLITSTISKVEKSKIKEMQNTKAFLNNLLASVDAKKIQLKDQKAKASIHSKTQPVVEQDLSLQLQTDPFLDEYDRRDDHQLNTPIHHLSQENQFMREPIEELNPLLPFTGDAIDDSNDKNHSEDALFQNYQMVYIKNAASKYEKLLGFIAEKYQKSANMEHFLKILNIDSFFEKDITMLTLAEDRLKLTYDDPATISFRLIIEMAFRLFQFKRSRRITIKCIQSFLELLGDKSGYQQISPSPEKANDAGVKLNAKIDFKYHITNKNIQCNKKSQNYIFCFEVVSELLKKAIGIYAVEPISCIISQIMPFSLSSSPSKLVKEMQKSRLNDLEQRQYDQLQKLIENEPKMEPARDVNYSTPLKKSKIPPIFQSNQKESRVKASEKWADVQKKVIMRRRQLEGKQKAINDS